MDACCALLMRELCCSEMLVPVALSEVDAGPEHLFEGAIRTLSLTVGLRVIRRAHGERGAELSPECTPEVCSEARITIAEDRLRHSVQPNDLAHEERGQLRCSDVRGGGDVVHHLGQLVTRTPRWRRCRNENEAAAVMRSMLTCCHGRVGIGSGISGPIGDC